MSRAAREKFLNGVVMATESRARWLVTCACVWGRECVSEWAAQSVSKLHPQLAQVDVTHVTRIEGPGERAGERQLSLT